MTRVAISVPTLLCGKPSLDGHQAPGLLDRFNHRRQVHRTQGPKVDDLGLDAHAGQFVSRLIGVGHANAERNDGGVLAGTMDSRLTDGKNEIVQASALRTCGRRGFRFPGIRPGSDRGSLP